VNSVPKKEEFEKAISQKKIRQESKGNLAHQEQLKTQFTGQWMKQERKINTIKNFSIS